MIKERQLEKDDYTGLICLMGITCSCYLLLHLARVIWRSTSLSDGGEGSQAPSGVSLTAQQMVIWSATSTSEQKVSRNMRWCCIHKANHIGEGEGFMNNDIYFNLFIFKQFLDERTPFSCLIFFNHFIK